MTDLFGKPLLHRGLNPATRARLLYAAGDTSPKGSPARAEFYRAAGSAQREADLKAAAQEAIDDKRAATRARSLANSNRHRLGDAAPCKA